uniref:Uncharacterized protein n=1 Tax=Myotis myotis TaxID=51298 RepID=A0A7J7XZI4_MYOMY|nr:hypothetical protein mMyoMyo1_011362 [Myotis myotis]
MGFDHPIRTREASSVAACLLPTTAILSLMKIPSPPCLILKEASLVFSSKENVLTFLPPSAPAPSSALCLGGSIICLASCRSPLLSQSQRAGQQHGRTSQDVSQLPTAILIFPSPTSSLVTHPTHPKAPRHCDLGLADLPVSAISLCTWAVLHSDSDSV